MIENLHRIMPLIESGWGGAHVLVIGDVMLDRYIWGDVDRISPEAPVPVVRVAHRSEQPGGAANVAMNIAGLGAQVTVAGFAGCDAERELLERCLAEAHVHALLTAVPNHPTTSKLRVLGGHQQILRLDVERTWDYPAEAYEGLLHSVATVLAEVDAVILSDYAKGVLAEHVCRTVIEQARARDIPVVVDPKHRDFARYAGATALCPNLAELALAAGLPPGDTAALLRSARSLLSVLRAEALVVTLSAQGIAVVRPGITRVFPAVARQVFDVSGAGDTVSAILGLAVASGLSIEEAAPLANIAAGIVVSKVGTVAVTKNELLTSLMPEVELQASEKMLPLSRLVARVNAWRAKGDRVVLTNGCFDLLHVGHIALLEEARRSGDRLIVAINSDASVRALKGLSRPVVGERDRGRVLAALSSVDAVVVFGEATPLHLIKLLRPDVIVKGGDYSAEQVVGAQEVRSWGGIVKIVPLVEGSSTTSLIARLQPMPVSLPNLQG